MMNRFPWQQDSVIKQTRRMLNSFEHWKKHSVFEEKGLPKITGSPKEIAKQLFEAPFVVVSHGTEADPIFNYGNCKALEIWELNWEDFTQLPSRKTAELVEQAERDRLLTETTKTRFCEYSGVRITSTGKRFQIDHGLVWNVVDELGNYHGQAAIFSEFYFL